MVSADIAARLACPRCRDDSLSEGPEGFTCGRCGVSYPVIDSIPVLAPPGPVREAILSRTDAGNVGAALFYNRAEVMEGYFKVPELPDDVTRWGGLIDRGRGGLTLEVGSGSGIFQDDLPNYVALDLSLFALRQYIKPEHPRVCGSAEELPFRDNSFAVVVSRAAIEHVPHPERAYAEILRVLEPGGMGYVFPSWNCAQWVCDALPIRPYRELTWRQRISKATLPIHRQVAWKGLTRIPWRIWRSLRYRLTRRPTLLAYRSLRPNYENFWAGDADACSNLDVFETMLYFKSRGCRMIHPPASGLRPLLARAEPVVFLKPGP
jgi:SAM-dependent methyltransferase/uncharacterized protein YbaR (Trm112 family)